jgi:hypothetical protein
VRTAADAAMTRSLHSRAALRFLIVMSTPSPVPSIESIRDRSSSSGGRCALAARSSNSSKAAAESPSIWPDMLKTVPDGAACTYAEIPTRFLHLMQDTILGHGPGRRIPRCG